jgi:hypothetical protein
VKTINVHNVRTALRVRPGCMLPAAFAARSSDPRHEEI